MSNRQHRIEDEARRLWAALHDTPPPPVEPSELIEMALSQSAVPGYDRLYSPHLRSGLLSRPR